MKAIDQAIKKLGNQSILAQALGVSVQAVNQWKSELRPIPPKRAVQIEKLTGVSRKDLCPQVFDGE